MKKLITILSLILFATIAMSQDEYVEWAKETSETFVKRGLSDHHGLIVKQANKEWTDDYSMISYEIKKQCKAMYEFYNMENPIGMPENTFKNIRATARLEWGEFDFKKDPVKTIKMDWTMVMYEIRKQIKAYNEIF